MTYIPDGMFSPGSLLGDAKSMNMRTVPYETKPNGDPKWDTLGKGSVVYIDVLGRAVPYDRSSGKEQYVVTPYGVVWKMTKVDPKAPKCSTSEPTVTIVTNGVIGVEYKEKMGWSLPPVLGQPVNEYGCLAAGVDKGEHIIGICDGVGTDPEDPNKIVIAVRLTPKGTELTEGSDPYTDYVVVCNQQTQKTGVNDDDDGTIPAYAPVRRVMTSNPEGVPSVKRWTSEAQDFYGYAAEPIPPGGTGKVVVGGLIDLPYVLPATVNDKDALSRGYRDVWILDHTETGEPWYKKVCTFIKDALITVEDVCNTLLLINNTKKAWSSSGRVKEDKPKTERGKLSLTSTNEEPVIDGWLTVDVNPVTIHAPSSLDYAVPADPATPLIPGHVYGGSNSGVREYQTNCDGLPFFGVCTALPLKGNTTPFVREGAVDVVAADDWDAGDYIDYTRHSIPEAYEPFIPHIGVAQSDTKAGELGAVHMAPWDPNTYAVYDHVFTSADVPPLGVTVSLTFEYQLYQFPKDYVGKSTDEIAGILRSYVPSSDANSFRNVIVQTGGYAVVPIDPSIPIEGYEYGNRIVTYLSDVRTEGDVTIPGWITYHYPPLGACNQLGRIVDTYSKSEATENTVVVKLDIQNLYRPDPTYTSEGVAVYGVPAWMQYNKVLHFGWWSASKDSNPMVLWRNSDTDMITTGWNPSVADLVEDKEALRVYLARPDGTVITGYKGEEGCCMSPAAHVFFKNTGYNILENSAYYTPDNPHEAHFSLTDVPDELKQLVEGEIYTYYFGLSADRKNALTTGYVTLVYDGEYKEEPEEPDLAARRVYMTPAHKDEPVVEPVVNDDTKHEPNENHPGKLPLPIEPPVYETV